MFGGGEGEGEGKKSWPEGDAFADGTPVVGAAPAFKQMAAQTTASGARCSSRRSMTIGSSSLRCQGVTIRTIR